MPRILNGLTAILLAIVAVGCETINPAPGADKIKITRNPSDVAKCKAVGNITVPKDVNGAVNGWTAATEFRNRTVGFGGNTGFVTVGSEGVPEEGIAYHCD